MVRPDWATKTFRDQVFGVSWIE